MSSVRHRRWHFPQYDQAAVQFLADEASLPFFVAQILYARGVNSVEQARRFLSPKLTHIRPPELLPGAREVAQHLLEAVKNQQKITVYGDYDVDGMTAAAILYRALHALNNNEVDCYIPSRLDDGYGLNADAIRTLAANGTRCIVTVDCGINSIHEAQVAKELGITLLITDHHTLGEKIPAATAIAHPYLTADQTSTTSETSEKSAEEVLPPCEICGAMVALKVAWMLGILASGQEKVSEDYRQKLCEWVGLATMGTIADVMPLIGENRALVHYGLDSALTKFPTVGLRALIQNNDKLAKKPFLAADDIGFQLAPRLNAAGRMGQEKLGLELMLTEDVSRASTLAGELQKLNELRQSRERKMLHEAREQIHKQHQQNAPALVLFNHEWHAGVLGIVASRLAEEFYRPVVMLAAGKADEYSGSARGVPGVSLYEVLERCASHLVHFGGHAMAAGLTLTSENLPRFREAFVSVVDEVWSPDQREVTQRMDAEVTLSSLTSKVVDQLESLKPFGAGNRRPILCATEVLVDAPAILGKDQAHFTAYFRQGSARIRGVAWGVAAWVEEMKAILPAPIDILFEAKRSTYTGAVELTILDWKTRE